MERRKEQRKKRKEWRKENSARMWWLINSFILHNAEGWKPNIMPLVDSEKACFLVQRGAVSWFTKVLLPGP